MASIERQDLRPPLVVLRYLLLEPPNISADYLLLDLRMFQFFNPVSNCFIICLEHQLEYVVLDGHVLRNVELTQPDLYGKLLEAQHG